MRCSATTWVPAAARVSTTTTTWMPAAARPGGDRGGGSRHHETDDARARRDFQRRRNSLRTGSDGRDFVDVSHWALPGWHHGKVGIKAKVTSPRFGKRRIALRCSVASATVMLQCTSAQSRRRALISFNQPHRES
jgi:hypothetical protein